ncbi:MAG: ribonuclease HI [Clostridiales bacterium]|jgi:ribonuclease HI|nr:ribonuclease HI [Clostridiales bacterium]
MALDVQAESGKSRGKRVEIYTDGACSGNPGPGGWAALLLYKGRRKEISGFEDGTTHNRMELLAAIRGLECLKEPCEVSLYSDSAYLVNAFQKGWVDRWIANGWRLSDKKTAAKNADLWQSLVALLQKHSVAFVKVRGHADNEHNNRCDALATGEIAARRKFETNV